MTAAVRPAFPQRGVALSGSRSRTDRCPDGYNGANSSFLGPGVLARDSADARLLLEALLARPLPVDDVRTVRVGLVRRPYWDDVDREVSESCENALAAVGLQQRELALPLAELGPSLLPCEPWLSLGRARP